MALSPEGTGKPEAGGEAGKTKKPQDGRPRGQEEKQKGRPVNWSSIYKGTPAQCKINGEAAYLLFLTFIIPVAMFLLWSGFFGSGSWNESRYSHVFNLYAYAWLAGTLGGTLFSLKWLVYAAAKGVWLEGKQWWRYLTPHLSGGLAFGFILLIKSNVINIFDEVSLDKPSAVAAIGFMIGYFSDKAAGKLAEVAKTLFGESSEGEFEEAEKRAKKQEKEGNRDEPGEGQEPEKPRKPKKPK